jgi:hypothetical protein
METYPEELRTLEFLYPDLKIMPLQRNEKRLMDGQTNMCTIYTYIMFLYKYYIWPSKYIKMLIVESHWQVYDYSP